MKKVFFLVLLVFCSSIAFGITQTIPGSFSGTGGGNSEYGGTITWNTPGMKITRIDLTSTRTDGDRCQIKTTGNSVLATATMTNYACVFDFEVSAGTTYVLAWNKAAGGALSGDYIVPNPSYTVDLTDFDMVNGWADGAVNNQWTSIHDIVYEIANQPSVNLTNRFKNFVYSNNSLPQNSIFLMQLNATGDSLVCNFSSKNISALFDNYFSENFTLTSDNSLEFSFEETSVGSEFDTINFNFCHTSAHKDLEIFINNNVTPFKTITSSLSCPLVSTVVNKTVVNTDHVNVSLRCPSCGGSNNLIILNLGGSSNFVYERFFSETTQALTFNDSIGSFWYDEHPYVFQSVGHKVIDFSCNASNFSYGVDVTDLPPVAVLGEVVVDGVEYDLSNSTVVPSGFSTEIIGNCLGDEIIVSRLLNLSYANGTFISSSISDILNFSSVEVPVDSNLSVRFACVDADGNSSFVVKSFEVLDRVNPVATYYSPLADNSSSVVKNNSFGLQMLFSDVNLYGVNVSCSHSIEGPVFDFVYLDIGGGSFFLENTTEGMNIAGTVVCEVEVCDDHTSSDYLIGSVKTSFDKRNITYRDKTLLVDLSVYDASKITFVGKPDRLSWCIDYDTFEDKFKDSLRYSYKVNKVDGWVLRDENTAHFVNWESKEWLDLVSSQDDSFLVERVVDEGDYYVIYVESKESSICFDSIGGLNCVDDVISFSVLDAPIVPITPNYDFSSLTTAVALFLGFLGILWVILLVGAGLTRSVGLGLVSVFLGFFFGMVLIPYIVSLGVALMVVNAVLFLGFVFEGKIL